MKLIQVIFQQSRYADADVADVCIRGRQCAGRTRHGESGQQLAWCAAEKGRACNRSCVQNYKDTRNIF